jgi:L-lactate dehydrogenase complex protein LldG
MVDGPEIAALVNLFIDRAVALGAVVEKVPDLNRASTFIANYCTQKDIQKIVASPGAQSLFGKNISFFSPPQTKDYDHAQAGVVVADHGIAETGTLVHLLNNDTEKLPGVLPRICLAVIESKKIVATSEAVADAISGHLSRAAKPGPQVAFISGPSRTADIECQLSLGVHGPASLIIIIVNGARP